MTGVPQARASIITRPNGSGQSIGKSNAVAPPSSSALARSPISPRNSTFGMDSRSGRISDSKYVRSAGSTFAAIRSESPASRATRIAESRRFSGEILPTNAR